MAAIDATLARSQQACARRDALDGDRALFETLTQRESAMCAYGHPEDVSVARS
jgi:hypothetical protein